MGPIGVAPAPRELNCTTHVPSSPNDESRTGLFATGFRNAACIRQPLSRVKCRGNLLPGDLRASALLHFKIGGGRIGLEPVSETACSKSTVDVGIQNKA